MHSSDSYALTEGPGSRGPGNPLSPGFKQERLDSPTFLDDEYHIPNTPGESAETESELFVPDNRSHSSKRKGMLNHTRQFCIYLNFSTNICLLGKGNAEMKIPRARKRNNLKSYVTEALASDFEIGDPESILEGASRSKMQYQDQQTRSRGISNHIFNQHIVYTSIRRY